MGSPRLAQLVLEGITPSSSADHICRQILERLYTECPRGFLDLKLFFIENTTYTPLEAKKRVQKMESGMIGMRDGIVVVIWGKNDTLKMLNALLSRMAFYIRLPRWSFEQVKRAYYMLLLDHGIEIRD